MRADGGRPGGGDVPGSHDGTSGRELRPPTDDDGRTEPPTSPGLGWTPRSGAWHGGVVLAGLLEGFERADRARWREQVLAALRRAGRADASTTAEQVEGLLSTEVQGLLVRPLHLPEDSPGLPPAPGRAPFTRGPGPRVDPTGASPAPRSADDLPPGALESLAAWDVRQRHGVPDAAATASEVLADLAGGVTSVWLRVGEGGVPVDDLPVALADVHLDLAPVILDAGGRTEAAADALLGVAAARGLDSASLPGGLGGDPLALAARTGSPVDLDVAVRLVQRCAADAPRVRALTVDTLPYAGAGAGAVESLALGLAAGAELLRALARAGVPREVALASLELRLPVTDDQFTSTALVRAARRTWARLAEASGAPPGERVLRLHAVTSPGMMTRRDPDSNVLRSAVAAFAAGTGGADAVTVLPFDSAAGRPDAVARRLARTTSTVLLLESSLGRVLDPAGGSWYVETLTEQVAQAAWARLRAVEADGGLAAALDSGELAARLAGAWRRTAASVARRELPVTGVTEFPSLAPAAPTRDPDPAGPSGGLPVHRLAEDFEELRDAADAAAGPSGDDRPAVLLLALGPTARSAGAVHEATNALAAGGLASPTSEAVVGPEQAVAAWRERPLPAVCLCGADDDLPAVVAALRRAGARRVLLAGPPDADAGADGSLHRGEDLLAELRHLHDLLDVPAAARTATAATGTGGGVGGPGSGDSPTPLTAPTGASA